MAATAAPWVIAVVVNDFKVNTNYHCNYASRPTNAMSASQK
jgi:hypothetical protein